MLRIIFFLLLFGLTGCSIPPEVILEEPTHPGRAGAHHSLPDFKTYESLHFIVRGNDLNGIMSTAKIAEDIYSKIMFDTNLLSFKPKQNYMLTIYRDKEEYRRDTGYPAWSAGGEITMPLGSLLPSEKEVVARSSIFTFEDVATPQLIAHEMTHLILNEFMAFERSDDFRGIRWINEGLATFEEQEACGQKEREELLSVTNPIVKNSAMTLENMVKFNPFEVRSRILGTYYRNQNSHSYSNITLWYWQAGSVTRFLIEKKGRYNFYILLNALKQKKDLVNAIQEAYPGLWRNLEDLEAEWKQSL